MNRSDITSIVVYSGWTLFIAILLAAQCEAYNAMPDELRAAYDQCIRLGGTAQACAAAITVKP